MTTPSRRNRHDQPTGAVLDAIDRVAARIRRHLGPPVERREREFAAICSGDQSALEVLVFWDAAPERRSLVEAALDDAWSELVSLVGAPHVRRDRLAGDTNVRISAEGVGRELVVFGPGGDEIGERILLTALGPCR